MKSKDLGCPKCVGKLEPVIVGRVEIDVCFICRGGWFEAGELQKLLKAEGGFFQNFLDQAKVFNKAPVPDHFDVSVGGCPGCAGAMVQKKFRGTTIDSCPRDHGIWLDGGELNNIIIHDLKIKYGIFWIVVFVVLLVITRGRILRAASGGGSFGGGGSGGGGASGSF